MQVVKDQRDCEINRGFTWLIISRQSLAIQIDRYAICQRHKKTCEALQEFPHKSSNLQRIMEFIEKKAEEFIDLDQSEEYQKAAAIVKRHTDILASVKTSMKAKGITEVKIRKGRILKQLQFNIRKMNRVDTNALPPDIREQYLKESDVWWKTVNVLDMGSLVEEIKKEENVDT
ncbi:hypothetical protein DFS34DRAFT_313429 [Phlyctochytrium arcticum]|nr:hypothetical protein DFS34DRAFT_313429 [Phlyctochytrium arcticum]